MSLGVLEAFIEDPRHVIGGKLHEWQLSISSEQYYSDPAAPFHRDGSEGGSNAHAGHDRNGVPAAARRLSFHRRAFLDTIERLVPEMDAMGVRTLVNLSGGSDPVEVKEKVDFIRGSKHPDRFAACPKPC
jgi:hypothetical protein